MFRLVTDEIAAAALEELLAELRDRLDQIEIVPASPTGC